MPSSLQPLNPTPVDFATPLGELTSPVVVSYAAEEGLAAFEVKPSQRGRVRVNVPGLPAAERATQAARVQLTFRAARAHAETVGMGHLPEPAREPAGRAAKALLIATDPAATDGEKRASVARATEILADLALYYLPRPDQVRDRLEGRRVLALPGRALPQEPQ